MNRSRTRPARWRTVKSTGVVLTLLLLSTTLAAPLATASNSEPAGPVSSVVCPVAIFPEDCEVAKDADRFLICRMELVESAPGAALKEADESVNRTSNDARTIKCFLTSTARDVSWPWIDRSFDGAFLTIGFTVDGAMTALFIGLDAALWAPFLPLDYAFCGINVAFGKPACLVTIPSEHAGEAIVKTQNYGEASENYAREYGWAYCMWAQLGYPTCRTLTG